MSHSVAPDDLPRAASPYGNTPFLLYSNADGSARVNHVLATIESTPTRALVTGFGRGVAARVDAGATLSLLWPSPSPEGFSLIADGYGELKGNELTIAISSAVLHRPAPVDGAPTC